ncbi:M20/M25/M40 family metallo-hydrolase [Verrucomicrobiales bacterium]|jgi:endoglucanase|nr:M20/M25/M40 family metallo-hydrolase [bacterium]MDC0312457.1 M20/M25/M40 family metallo-hydrolase [Verrucomicrobiales bacterium]MDF1786729.1 M20/M25/M40 family metallo-hydrolase [Verrucomicrobiales bacterium]
MRTEAERLLKLYSETPGASGNEELVRKVFCQELNGHAFSADRTGCVLAARDGDPKDGPRVMLTAHMDEVGFMVQNITKTGFIEIVPLGGWWPHVVLAQGVIVMASSGRAIPGCVASIPPHQLGEGAASKVMALDKMSIDIGGDSREQVMEEFGVQLGDSIVPATKFKSLAHPDRFLGKAFDNRVGMALLTQSMCALKKKKLPNQLLGVATVQEEVGCRGAVTASALAKPDVALVLEGPPADDTPGMNRDDAQGALGEGVQLRVMDPRALSSRRLVDFVVSHAKAAGIDHQVTVRRGGGTDASAIHLHDQGVPSIVLGVPTRYIHSHHSILQITDYLEAMKLIDVLVRAFDAEAVNDLTDFLRA